MYSQNVLRNLLIVASMLIGWAPVQAWVLNALHGVDWVQALLDGGLTTSYLILVGFIQINILNYYHPKKKYLPFVILGSWLLGYIAVIGAVDSIEVLLTGPFDYMDGFYYYRLIFSELIMMIVLVLAYNATTTKSTEVDDKRRIETEKMARDAELASLRQQLQPHFLFNSLNSINALIVVQPEKARKMVQQLSDFLRGTIKKDDSQLVPLFDEMQQLKLYLEIEKVRFGHRLAANIENENRSLEARLPPLLIQPVVENAIKFGLYDTVGETIINIKTRLEQNHLFIQVENPFDSETSAPRSGTGFGLSSLQRRLYLLYARNDLLTTSHDGNIFITQIKIPQV